MALFTSSEHTRRWCTRCADPHARVRCVVAGLSMSLTWIQLSVEHHELGKCLAAACLPKLPVPRSTSVTNALAVVFIVIEFCFGKPAHVLVAPRWELDKKYCFIELQGLHFVCCFICFEDLLLFSHNEIKQRANNRLFARGFGEIDGDRPRLAWRWLMDFAICWVASRVDKEDRLDSYRSESSHWPKRAKPIYVLWNQIQTHVWQNENMSCFKAGFNHDWLLLLAEVLAWWWFTFFKPKMKIAKHLKRFWPCWVFKDRLMRELGDLLMSLLGWVGGWSNLNQLALKSSWFTAS